jgi:hypothetical protein
MSKPKFNACFAKPKGPSERDGVYWIRFGTGVGTEKGIKCFIDAIPLNWNGEFMLFEQTDDRLRSNNNYSRTTEEDIPL